MRCIFCKQPSNNSRSVEHVIPESLGNHTLVLRPGAVCDACNNYFSRKVEAPFLNAPWIRMLRHEQGVASKRGRVPTMRAIAPGLGEATMHAPTSTNPRLIAFDTASQSYRWLLSKSRNVLLTDEVITPPSHTTTSRFLAKVAIEFLASRLELVPGGLDYLVNEVNLDRLRDYARRGSGPHWPVSIRRLYSANARWRENAAHVQRVWEAGFFQDDVDSQYVIIVIFGVEFAIHLGEPDISGYRRWLLLNRGRSPLYSGRYATQVDDRDGTFDRRHRAIVGSSA
jgi:hypothetical protein